jgi:hypothetical protein
VPYKTPITLTATVTAGGSPVTSGLVMFCDASAAFCENNSSLLGVVQLTTSGTAVVKIGSGPLGVHSYKAVYRANSTYASSTSSAVSYTVQGTYQTSTVLASSGTIGNYNLSSTVSGVGAITSPGPSGSVSFEDVSAGNNLLGTQNLGTPVLTNTFSQAPNSPFAIGDGLTTKGAHVIASTYLDGDNNIDVVTGDADHVITVLLGNGDGTFQPKVNHPGCPTLPSDSPGLTNAASTILLADFNRDGNSDAILGCANRTSGGVAVLLGNGAGSFQTPIWNLVGDLAGLAMGDFNNDGKLDIAMTIRTPQDVLVMLGKGDGTFFAPVSVSPIATSSNQYMRNIVVADLDGDGNDDLAYAVAIGAPSTLSNIYVQTGKGDGTFNAPQLSSSQVGEFLTSGDTNNDGKPDIISSTVSLSSPSHISNSMFVLIGNGDGTLQPKVTYVSDIPSDPHLADVDGDGNADIIAGGSYGALVYHGNGDGTFQPYDEPVIGGFSLTYAVNAGDYNNDGNADLIGTDADNPRAAVALSEVKQAADAVALTGVAVFPLGSGIHNVDAAYSGDTIYITSTSSTVPLRAAPVSTTLALATSPSTTAVLGSSVTLTATLAPYTVTGPPSTSTDTQTVNFYRGSTQIGTGILTNGVATLTTSTLPSGTAALKATFPGTLDYQTSTSSTVNLIVSSVTLASSPNPSNYAQNVTLTATVVSGATGTVQFFDGTTSLGTATIAGTTATTSTALLDAGSHSLTAVYSGDGSHAGATSPAVTQVVNKINPSMSVTTSGQTTFLSTVTITASVPSTATGSVVFTSGAMILGTANVSSGTASITTTALPVGANPITASYGGDTNYNSGTATTSRAVTKATPTTTLTSSLNPSTYASSVTFTNTLTSTVTGTVTFTSDATVLGTVSVSNGVATLTTTTLAVGSSTITATYNGDTNYVGAVATLPQVVGKAAPTLALTSSVNPSIAGQSTTLSATLPTTVTGTVTFSEGSTTLGTVTVTNGVATLATSSLAVGTHTISAQYGGDSNNQSASSTLNQVVNKANTAVALSSSLNPSNYGDSITLNAAVTSAGSIAPTGTVIFSSGSTTLGTVAISGGVASFSTSALAAGSPTITASYSGDGSSDTSSSTLAQTINKVTPALSLSSSHNPASVGETVTLTATMDSSIAGTVTFTEGATVLGTGTLSNGTAVMNVSSLAVGSHTLTATYNGDTNHNTTTATLTQTVSKKTPTISVATSGPSTFGQSVTITATLPSDVTGSVSFTSGSTNLGTGAIIASGVATITTSALPVGTNTITANYTGDTNNNSATGTTTQAVSKNSPVVTVTTSGPSTSGSTVTITANLPTNVTGTVTFTEGSTTVGTATVTNGVATVTTSTLPIGTTTITATYSGDTNNNTATGNTTQTVTKASPSVTLSSSHNPSQANQSVTFTATLPSTVTGSVTFTEGSTTLGTVALSSGVASISTSTLSTGAHTITVTYAGDTNNNGSNASLVQSVNQNATTITVTTSGPSTYGNTVTVTATVPTGATGTVTFTSGSTTIGTGTVNPSTGTVSVTTSTLPVGTNTITASYSGDTSYGAATGSTTQTVSKVTPTITVTTSGPSSYGEPVTVTTTLPPGTTGTVTFTSGGNTVGTGTVNPTTGVTTITTSTLPIGSQTITATYSGDTNNNTANGSTTQSVGKTTPTVGLASSLNPSTFGQTVMFTATVPSAATGSITFFDGVTSLGTVAVSSGQASVAVSTFSTGTHNITAAYTGDTNYNNATSSPLGQVVNKFIPSLPPPTVSDANPNPNTPVTITEQVPSGVTGTVTFSNGSTVIGTAPIVGGVATITVPSLPIGTNPITASVGETDNFTSATSPSTTVTVAKLTPTVTLTSSANPSSSGQPVIFTANVPTAATGTVTFSNGGTIIGTVPVVNGVATLSNSTLTSGSHNITATYSGDTTYNTGTSAPLIQVVDKSTPALPAPAVSNPTQVYGGTQTISETVPPGVTGPVTFYSGSTVIGTAPIVNGVATITVTTLPVGTNPITASTPGDANNNPATSPATIVTVTKTTPVLPAPIVSDANPNPNTPVTITEQVPNGVTGTVTFSNGSTVIGTAPIVNGVATITVPSLPIGTNPITASVAETATTNAATSPSTPVTVGLITPTVALTSSLNPAAYSQTITFTASVPAAATGTITFLDGTTVLGSGTVNGAGVASFTTSSLAIGTHAISASYGGNASYKSAVSTALSQVVSKLPSTITLSVSSGSSFVQNSITWTAVVATSVPTPTGTVTFLEGTTVLGTAALTSNGGVVGLQLTGNAVLAISTLSSGSHSISAVYSGDATFLTSTSAPVATAIHDFTNKNTGDASHELYPGDTAIYKFTLAPVGTTTFLSNVNLSVTGLPENATYTMSPTSLNGGAGSTEVTLTVKTSSKLNTAANRPTSPASRGASPLAFALLGFVGLGAARRYRKRMPRLLLMLLLLGGSLLPLASLAGCAGGYYAPKPTSFTVTVTGTEGALQRSATATLIVQQ